MVGATLLAVLGAAACVPPPPPPPPPVCGPPPGSTAQAVAVMGPCARISADQMASWFSRQSRPTYRAPVPIEELTRLYVEEGAAEGVRGDLAFAQAILETGWFSFPDTGSVRPWYNNFAGLGATDVSPSPAQFPDARTGIRAQIQHLRAYADPTATRCAVPPLHNPCVDPRFDLVSPKGKAPTWNQFGNGVWATSTTYAQKVLDLYARMLNAYGGSLA